MRLGLSRWITALASTRYHFAVATHDAGINRAKHSFHIGPRTLDEHMIWMVLRGSLGGVAGGQGVSIDAGSLLWVPPGVKQEFSYTGNLDLRFFFVRFRLQTGRRPVVPTFPFMVERDARLLEPIIEQIIEETRSDGPWSALRQRARFVLLFTMLADRGSVPRVSGPTLALWQRQQLIRHVHKNIEARLTPADLAQVVRLSPGYFARVFARSFGVPPKSWLMRERIRLAAMTLAETNLSVKEVADQFGYENLFLFSRQFKKVLGRSPRAFRRRQ